VRRRRGVTAVGESPLIGPDPFTVILVPAYPLVTKRLSLSERSPVEKRSFATRSL
jgi:hypothetical protein